MNQIVTRMNLADFQDGALFKSRKTGYVYCAGGQPTYYGGAI